MQGKSGQNTPTRPELPFDRLQCKLTPCNHEPDRTRAIVEASTGLDGVRYNSRFAGHPCAALFLPAATALPHRPIISLPLTHPALASRLAGTAERLGYSVI